MNWSQSDLIIIMDLSPKKNGIKYGVQQARRFIAEREKEKVVIVVVYHVTIVASGHGFLKKIWLL